MLITKLCLCQKDQKHHVKQKFWTRKKHDVQDFWNAPSVMFLNKNKKKVFEVFLVFLTKKSLILSALKQNIVGEIKQSNGIKPPKNLLSQDFLYVFSSQRKFLVESVFINDLYLLPETYKISLLCTDLPPFIWNWVLCYPWYYPHPQISISRMRSFLYHLYNISPYLLIANFLLN